MKKIVLGMLYLFVNFSVLFAQDWNAIDLYWNKIEGFNGFNGVDNGVDPIKIRYKIFKKEQEKGAIVICSGRTECMLKYKEVVYDFNQAGYSVYIYDHRGQGFSDRMLKDIEKGHVEKFDHYVTDLENFVDIVTKDHGNSTPLFLLAHSMGGAVTSLYLEKHPNSPFKSVVLCSPMYGIRSVESLESKIKEKINKNFRDKIKALIKNAENNESIKKIKESYVLGTSNYVEEPFTTDNLYTHDKNRYEKFINGIFREDPMIIVGGPTNNWLLESYRAGKKAIENAKTIQVSILIIQAGADAVVANKKQYEFFENLNPKTKSESEILSIPDASHELFIESDIYRSKTIEKILNFIQK